MGTDAQAFDGLSFTEDMAWSMETLPVLPATPTLLRLDAQNLQTLMADASLGDSRRSPEPADENAAICAELHRREC